MTTISYDREAPAPTSIGRSTIAVLMSVYWNDRVAYVRQAVESVLGQTHGDLDLLICVDGRIDQQVKSYLTGLRDTRVRLYPRRTNEGLASALNLLLDDALRKGYEYLARMDADDICFPDRLAREIEFLTRNPHVQVVGSGCAEIDETGTPLAIIEKQQSNSSIRRNLAIECPFVHSSVLMRSSVFRSGIRYPVNYHLTEDYALWVLLQSRGYVFSNLPEPLIYYRRVDGFAGRRRGWNKAWAEFRVRGQAMALPEVRRLAGLAFGVAALAVRLLPRAGLAFVYACHRHVTHKHHPAGVRSPIGDAT